MSSFIIVQFLLKETIKAITKLNIIPYLSPHEKNHDKYHLCKIDTYLEKFFKWRMYHGVWNKRQSIERKKLCSLAQCSSFCFQVCLKTRNPFLKFSFVLGNKAAYLENYHSECTVKLANTSKRTKYINIKFEIKFEYLLSKKQHLFN